MGESLTQDAWIARVLGIGPSVPAARSGGPKVSGSSRTNLLPPRSMAAIRIGADGPHAQAQIAPPPPPITIARPGGGVLQIGKSADGRPILTAPPPPVREICFSGGGAKGSALPGAVKALQESGVLKGASKIAGASVGSMTAALVACGATAEEFARIGNAQSTLDKITDGTGGGKLALLGAAISNRGSPLTGKGLEQLARGALAETVGKRIHSYISGCINEKTQPDAGVIAVATRLTQPGASPTFGDLRVLHKVIPDIKEVVISGTYTTEFDDSGATEKLADGNTEGQLYVFDADSEPDMEVAVAVHASASFPFAFKPVDITLSSGLTVRFIDGGVMNNTPTSSSIGNRRELDPLPASRSMTFVFEDSDGVSKGLLQGKVPPQTGKMAQVLDWVLGAENAAANYATYRDLAEHSEEVVEVPLTVTLPGKNWHGGARGYDMRDGTLDFGVSDEVKMALQDKTEQATKTQIAREQQPKSREFASDSQMFMALPMADLRALADAGYEGAADALAFRDEVTQGIALLTRAVQRESAKDHADMKTLLASPEVADVLGRLDALAGADIDRQGHIGREMNRGGLDLLVETMKSAPPGGASAGAALAVSDALRVRDWADNALKQVIYPRMKQEAKDGTGITMLLRTEKALRAARTPGQFNTALSAAIDHFRSKPDGRIFSDHNKQFAASLSERLMRAA